MNKLLWKLLQQHISTGQLVGFFFANLFGLFVILFGYQFYQDIIPFFSGENSVIKNTFIVISKRISTSSTLNGESVGFTPSEINEVAQQPFTKKLGSFKTSQYRVYASFTKGNASSFGTDMFFESVPNDFVDVNLKEWKYNPNDLEIPIIIPRSYLALYNFGFAQSQQLPKLSEGVVSMMTLDIFLSGSYAQKHMVGRVVGFSNRLNTILVPEQFIEWSNHYFSNIEPDNQSMIQPTRLIVEVNNPTNENITKFIKQNDYETSSDGIETGKATFFIKIIAGIVMLIGFLISALSLYILMLSVYLLIQKNSNKLQNLLLIGYSHTRISLPYISLTVIVNFLVILFAWLLLVLCRKIYLNIIWQMFPLLEASTVIYTFAVSVVLFLVITAINFVVIRHKIKCL